MRRWLALGMFLSAGAAHAAPALRVSTASRFDLASLMLQPALEQDGHAAASRWMIADIAPPPGPPHDPPLVKFRGKKVKFRMSF